MKIKNLADTELEPAPLTTGDHACVGCRSCPSAHPCHVTRRGTGPIAVVLDHPTEAEETRDAFMAGKRGGASDLLRTTLEAAGLDPKELYVCSALNCRPNVSKKAMLKKAMLSCRERLLQELKEANIEKVLSVGSIAYSALMSSPTHLAVTKIRGRWKQAYGMNVMATLPPGFVLGEPDYFRDLAYDINKFAGEDGPTSNPDVQLWIPETLAEVEEAFATLMDAPFVSCDLETTGFSPIADYILAAGFGFLHVPPGEDYTSAIDATIVILDEALLGKTKVWRSMMKVINDPELEVVFHNAKFDLQFFKSGAEHRELPYAPAKINDTMLLNYTLDERPMGKFSAHSLESLARVHFDAPDYGIGIAQWLQEWWAADEFDKRELRRQMHIYLGLDCYYTARLFPELWNRAMLEDEKLLDLYEDLLLPGAIAIADIEHHGLLVDREHFEQLRDELDEKVKPIHRRLQRVTKRKDFNPGSPKQVKEFIYDDLGLPFGLHTDKDGKTYHTARRGGLQEGPTAAPVLKQLAYRFPEHKKVIDDICEYRNLTKNIGTYVNGVLDRIDVDGRMRSSFNLHGTATGRLSSSNPNLQNVPDASHTGIEIRAGFVAGEGNVLIEADYKQLEVRIAAWLSDDDAMRAIFEGGRDPHQEIAHSIYHKPKEEITHYMRWLAKNILFGLLYGRGYESVATGPEQEDIAARGGERWGLEEVKEFYDNLLAEWEDFAEWQRNQRELGYREGEITMPTGRRRRFGFIPKHDAGYVGRASFNNPIQGTASDFTLWALIRLHELLPEGADLVLTVHDSLMVECREELADEVAALIEHVMIEDQLIELDVPLAVDIDVSRRWGEEEFAKQHELVVPAT